MSRSYQSPEAKVFRKQLHQPTPLPLSGGIMIATLLKGHQVSFCCCMQLPVLRVLNQYCFDHMQPYETLAFRGLCRPGEIT